MKTNLKVHIPKSGWGTGLVSMTLCGRGARFSTGDHNLLRQLALGAMREGDHDHYCQHCITVLATQKGAYAEIAR